jgi:hypothetical protein
MPGMIRLVLPSNGYETDGGTGSTGYSENEQCNIHTLHRNAGYTVVVDICCLICKSRPRVE